MSRRLAYATLLVGLAACSSSPKGALQPIDANFNFDFDGGGPGPIVGPLTDSAVDDGPTLAALDLAGDPGGPVIEVQSPPEGSDVQYDVLTVTARITSPPPSVPIAAESVLVIIPSSTASSGTVSAPLTLTAMPNIYQGSIDISAIRSGDSEFVVAAQDIAGKKSSVKVGYRHDHGPVITFVRPTKPTAKGSITLEIVVDDGLYPLMDGSTVQAGIRTANDIALVVTPGASPLRLSANIDFSTYNPPLAAGQLIRVQATNSKGTITHASKQFTVDNDGPHITFVKPMAGGFVGGVLQIEATIEDISGVNEMTAVAVFGGDVQKWSTPLAPVMSGSSDFVGFFDVRQLGRSYVFPTLSVRADDTLGNHSELAEEIVVDNTPPMMSLDPPKMRVAKLKNGVLVCSQAFDPVGKESANDLDPLPQQQIITLKARVEDQGNNAKGLLVERISGIDPSSVTLVAIPASNGPLAVDTDGDPDHICDDVNPLLVPSTNVLSSNEAVELAMVVLTGTGTADFTQGPTVPADDNCGPTVGDTTTPPAPLCTQSGTYMTYVLPTPSDGPAIWSIPPVTNDAFGCIGFQLDSLNHLPEGPTCVAVRGRDKAGNTNVSPPLRLCIDRGGHMCDTWPASPPDCTGTYDKKTNTVSATTKCTPETMFPSPAGTYEIRIVD